MSDFELLKKSFEQEFGMNKEAGLNIKPDTMKTLNAVSTTLDIISSGLAIAGTVGKMGQKLKKKVQVSSINTPAIAKQLTMKHPDWSKEEVEKYLNQLKIHVPEILADMALVEEVVRRAILYGGLDPAYIMQLKSLYFKPVVRIS